MRPDVSPNKDVTYCKNTLSVHIVEIVTVYCEGMSLSYVCPLSLREVTDRMDILGE